MLSRRTEAEIRALVVAEHERHWAWARLDVDDLVGACLSWQGPAGLTPASDRSAEVKSEGEK